MNAFLWEKVADFCWFVVIKAFRDGAGIRKILSFSSLMRHRLLRTLPASLVVFMQSSAFAQVPTPGTKTPEATNLAPNDAPKVSSLNQEREDDLVVLKDGSRYRGKIVEAVAGEHILIEVSPGTVRQLLMTEVVYAGPIKMGPPMTAVVTGAPAPAPAPLNSFLAGPTAPALSNPVTVATTEVSAKPGEAIAHFQSKTPGLIVWVASEPLQANQGTGFKRLCETPCSYPLLFGDYRIAYSIGASTPRESKSRIRIQRETHFETELVSNRAPRVLGWVVLGIGAAAGTVMLSTGVGLPPGDERRSKYVTGGVVALAGGVLVGLALGLTPDAAVVVDVTPPVKANGSAASNHDSFHGLSFVGRF
jgi:hypothetical protein